MDDPKRLQFYQKLIFLVLFIGYTFYILDRKSFAFNIPNIKQTEGLESESIGSIISSIALGYGIGKFAGGILVDSFSAKYLFSSGLILCGGINLIFSVSTTTGTYAALCFANGLFQGLGWPSCAKLLRRWYSPTIFGTLWSLLSAAMNVAAVIGPFICIFIMNYFGSWRYSMQAFGTLSILSASLVLLFVHDNPKDCGFTTNNISVILAENEADSTENKEATQKSTKAKLSLFSSMKLIFVCPFLYIVSAIFLVILFSKGAVCDWGPLYFITEKNATKTMASAFSGTLEFGGIIGNICSGVITDWISSSLPKQEKGNPRNYFMIPCIAVLIASLTTLRIYIEDFPTHYYLSLTLAFIIGFTLYSIISIVGVMTIEKASSDLSGTCHAIAALFGNVGLTISGLPFSILVEKYSWTTAFSFIEMSLFSLVVLAAFSQGIDCHIGDKKKKD